MGYALAGELAARGARVTLVSGPVSLEIRNPRVELIPVTSAEEMDRECRRIFPETNGAVLCAAVADYTPVEKSSEKRKRGEENLVLTLKPNPDIAAGLGQMKKPGQILVGFALETGNEYENAYRKLIRKNLDLIVLNSLNDEGAGFQTDTNKITIIDRQNNFLHFELKSKTEVASDIVDRMMNEMML